MVPRENSTWDDLLESAQAWMLLPESVPADDLERCCSAWLSLEERHHMARLQKASLRHDYLAARALCRRVISQSTGIEPVDLVFHWSPSGKPLLAGPSSVCSLEFNLTHTAGLLVCLLSRAGAFGVDAEDLSRPVEVDSIARHFLSSAARESLLALPSQERLNRLYAFWVLNEAYIKGRGLGLAAAGEQMPIDVDHEGRPVPIDDWQLSLFHPTPRHIAATAIQLRGMARTVPVHWTNVTPDALLGRSADDQSRLASPS